MNLKEYQLATLRTFPDLGEKLNLAHMLMGMHSEWNEFVDSLIKDDDINQREETADQFWYISNYCNIRKLDLFVLFENRNVPDEGNFVETYWTSKLTDVVKKYIVYNKPIDIVKEEVALKAYLYLLCEDFTDEEIYEMIEKNINKLKIRYPEKFTEELAINRNLTEELKTLK